MIIPDIKIDDGGGRTLRRFARRFPKEFPRALRSLGWELRKDLQDYIRMGGPGWQRMSDTHRSGRLVSSRRKYFKAKYRVSRLNSKWSGGLTRARRAYIADIHRGGRFKTFMKSGAGKKKLYGKMIGAVRYEVSRGQDPSLRLGFLGDPNMRSDRTNRTAFLAARVQAGRRGAPGRLSHDAQPVTSKMRRMFFAAGVGIPKGKRFIRTPKREIIEPFYNKRRTEIPRRIEKHLYNKIKGIQS